MNNEMHYTRLAGANHIKKYCQYFTNSAVADFMCAWACKHAQTMLDPAVGNSVFFLHARKSNGHCRMTGYELDGKILQYFGNPASADIIQDDYLLNGWDEKYDAIVCNPPYSRFQAVDNRSDILDAIYRHTGIKYSGYTNLYILFLIKGIFQMSDTGRLAYIIPTEFMNSKYGTAVKQMLIDRELLFAVINFEDNDAMFFNATTTCCILLLDRSPKKHALFYNLSSIDQLSTDMFRSNAVPHSRVSYNRLSASEKWRCHINQERQEEYRNLKPVSQFCSVSRGIATGDNEFFCFSRVKAAQHGIPEHCLSKCICHSADIREPVFTAQDFEMLADTGKTVYVLDVRNLEEEAVAAYVSAGITREVHQKYLPSRRKPWYSMEKKSPAPVWVCQSCRGKMKFVRNLAGIKNLTTFHAVYIHPDYHEDTDLIFSYFLTPTAQQIMRGNRKELGSGLEKFQPNDLNTAMMLDMDTLSPDDRAEILRLYQNLTERYSEEIVSQMDGLFRKYLI